MNRPISRLHCPCSTEQITLCHGLASISMNPLARERIAMWENSTDEVMGGLV